MLEYIYTIKPVRATLLTDGPTDEEALVLENHAAYLEAMAEHGELVLAGRTQTSDMGTFGIVIFRATSDAVAQERMNADPAVASGIMAAELHPYHVSVRGSFDAAAGSCGSAGCC